MRKIFTGKRRHILVIIGIVAVVLGTVTTVRMATAADTRAVCAHFDNSFGLFPGAPVTIRGITVGTVNAVEPEGAGVRVAMDTERRDLPADAGAVITNASILTDRRVELVHADPGPGPTLAQGSCIDQSRTRTPVSVSDALGSFSDLVHQVTERRPDGTAPLESMLRNTGRQVDGLGPTLNKELRSLADLLAEPDNFMAQLGALLDNSAEMSTFVGQEWDDIKVTLQTFAPGLNSIAQMLIVAKVLVQKLSKAVGPLDRIFHEHFPYLMNTLNSTLPVAKMVRTRTEQSSGLLDKVPGVVQMLQTMIGSHPGSVAVEVDPPRAEVGTPDPAMLCTALSQASADSCRVQSEQSASVPLPQLVLSTIGVTP